jgi:hypothetical protein
MRPCTVLRPLCLRVRIAETPRSVGRLALVLMKRCGACGVLTNNSVARVHERTVPTERPPLVGQVRANFLPIEGVLWSARRIPMSVISVFWNRSRYFFFQVAPQLYSRG